MRTFVEEQENTCCDRAQGVHPLDIGHCHLRKEDGRDKAATGLAHPGFQERPLQAQERQRQYERAHIHGFASDKQRCNSQQGTPPAKTSAPLGGYDGGGGHAQGFKCYGSAGSPNFPELPQNCLKSPLEIYPGAAEGVAAKTIAPGKVAIPEISSGGQVPP